MPRRRARVNLKNRLASFQTTLFVRVHAIENCYKGKMESTNLEKVYDEATKLLLTEGNKYYFPSSALDDFKEDFQDVSISFEDDETANQLKMMILQQNLKLKEAKEKLRILLKDNFSIEELLFQNNSRPTI
jgi:hypothetical protein